MNEAQLQVELEKYLSDQGVVNPISPLNQLETAEVLMVSLGLKALERLPKLGAVRSISSLLKAVPVKDAVTMKSIDSIDRMAYELEENYLSVLGVLLFLHNEKRIDLNRAYRNIEVADRVR